MPGAVGADQPKELQVSPTHVPQLSQRLWNGAERRYIAAEPTAPAVPPPRPIGDPDENGDYETAGQLATANVPPSERFKTVSHPDELSPSITAQPDVGTSPRVVTPQPIDGITAKPVSGRSLDLFRPLHHTTLAASVRLEQTEDEPLRMPEDQAAAIFAGFGQFGDLPCHLADGTIANGDYAVFFHPLYFEEPNMERCGHGYGYLTDAVSAVNFFGRMPLTPYLIGANPPWLHVRSLGDCPNCHRYSLTAYVPSLIR